MKSDLPWKEHGKSEEMTESGETGVHKGGEGGGGQKRLERLAAEKTESGGKPGSAQARPGSLCPGLGEGDTEAGTALSREGHLETGIGRFRRKQV